MNNRNETLNINIENDQESTFLNNSTESQSLRSKYMKIFRNPCNSRRLRIYSIGITLVALIAIAWVITLLALAAKQDQACANQPDTTTVKMKNVSEPGTGDHMATVDDKTMKSKQENVTMILKEHISIIKSNAIRCKEDPNLFLCQ
ncbi:unnamed protein product [Owenia fusiformis]|uniref:Uncharacterized protein n=1 Tax=Owenia fusiformis TaxID=6347 RepID=A0A8S4NDS3_OWEFU|nr:unnamed protein product [Owenia fusiformis]